MESPCIGGVSPCNMPPNRAHLIAALLSVTLHGALILLASQALRGFRGDSATPRLSEQQAIVHVQLLSPTPNTAAPTRQAIQTPTLQLPPTAKVPAPRATLAAPPPPSPEDWAFAARYTLKNSKGYRYSWGQQLRSMMGTAVEGPDQGFVRFRIEIAPDGRLTRLDTLWTTSAHAEQLARKAVQNMPALPPTPTGQTLVFEKTIAFTPFASEGPPVYTHDCLPDPPVFRNPFVWDGQSASIQDEAANTEKPDPQALQECLKQLPHNSVEAESAHDQRIMDRWGWSSQHRK